MSGPRYPNQQLRSVSLEVYFPGELSTLTSFGDVQRAVADRFPALFVPNLTAGEAPALRPYVLKSPDKDKGLRLAVNQIGFYTSAYPGFTEFGNEAIEIIERALDIVKPRAITRVLYRYENEVGIQREADGTLPLERIFPGVIPRGGKGGCRSIDVQCDFAFNEADVSGSRGYHARTEDRAGNHVLLVTVHGSIETCKIAANVAKSAKTAHETAYRLFEDLISEDFRKFISGGDVK